MRYCIASGWFALLALGSPTPSRAETIQFKLEQAAFQQNKAPDVMVRMPDHLGDEVDLVLFFHGWSGCAATIVSSIEAPCYPGAKARQGMALFQAHENAHARSLLIVPQLALLERRTDAGRFSEDSFADHFLEEVLSRLAVTKGVKRLNLANVGSISIYAHSAGYKPVAEILKRENRVRSHIKTIVLMDALYAEPEVFRQWLKEMPNDRHLVSIVTPRGTPHKLTQQLSQSARIEIGVTEFELTPETRLEEKPKAPLIVMRTLTSHGQIPRTYFERLLIRFR